MAAYATKYHTTVQEILATAIRYTPEQFDRHIDTLGECASEEECMDTRKNIKRLAAALEAMKAVLFE